MSDGTTKKVNVKWEPNSVDTSSVGTVTVMGTVEGFNGIVTFNVTIEAVETGGSQISLFKDSTSSSNKLNFENITEFYLKHKKTGKVYKDGTIPSQSARKNQFLMKDLPKGEYEVHAVLPGMSIKEIQLGSSGKETKYDANLAPLVITKDNTTYVKIILVTESILVEISELEDVTVSGDITRENFINSLPGETTILDSKGKEHQVDLKWDIRPFVFDSWNKPGQYTIESEFFTLPLDVSNSVPATRLKVSLKVIFVD